jgi:hypothetical protein
MQSLISISPINPVKDSKSIGAFQAKNHPGFFYSFLSSLSFGPIFGQASVMKEVCQNFGDKIQIVWGDKDDVVPLERTRRGTKILGRKQRGGSKRPDYEG